MVEQNDLVKKLPDCYEKKPAGNNNKLLSLSKNLTGQLRNTLIDLEKSLDLNLASGKTLDLYGAMYEQSRGGFEDVRYRYLILTKIARNAVGADYESILNHIATMFNCSTSDISLDDTGNCTVQLTKMPIEVLLNAGFTSKQAAAMIESLMPVGANLSVESFDGTFEFSASDDDFSEEAGFDYGTLSMLFGEDEDIPIPV